MNKIVNVFLANPRGFCAGVERAVEIVERALKKYGPPVYVRHEIVHNPHVVKKLAAKGTIFVEEINEIPEEGITIFSAHGVSKKVKHDACKRNLNFIDATCPLVNKVHNEAVKYDKLGYKIFLIGHKGHPEVEGTAGQIKNQMEILESLEDVLKLESSEDTKVAYITQTTLSVCDTKIIVNTLKEKFPNIVGPNSSDICYATQNRQDAVRELSKLVQLVLVMGGANSSNSARLTEISSKYNIPSYRISDPYELNPDWLKGKTNIGITAGASTPEEQIKQLLEYLKNIVGGINIREIKGLEEKVFFKLPKI